MKSSKLKIQSSRSADGCRRLPPAVFELRTSNFCHPLRAFTLVEMMVVVAIIALLLAALLPAFSAVRNQARYAQANAQFKALDTGINAFRAEAALGGSLPPSSTDGDDSPHSQKIADPKGADPNTKVRVAGAHLLVQAMIGADGLGTPGFRDVNHDPKGLWSDDTHKRPDDADLKKCGIYATYQTGDQAGKERFPRYGGAGYVDEKMRKSTESLAADAAEGRLLNLDALLPDVAKNELMFMDPWDRPILYYKASPTSLRMTGTKDKPGIFWQEDNGIITGSDSAIQSDLGLDFGQGTEGTCNSGKCYHHIAVAKSPDPTEIVDAVRTTDEAYKSSFARFIIDGSVKSRPAPVQKDSYLLISAGPDARYGTNDDVLNWTRKTD